MKDTHPVFTRSDKLLNTKLEAWMLVPCDLEGWPMFEPDKERLEYFDAGLIPNYQDEYLDLWLWKEGQKRTVFKGFRVNETGDDIINNEGVVVAYLGQSIEWECRTIGELCAKLTKD